MIARLWGKTFVYGPSASTSPLTLCHAPAGRFTDCKLCAGCVSGMWMHHSAAHTDVSVAQRSSKSPRLSSVARGVGDEEACEEHAAGMSGELKERIVLLLLLLSHA